MTLVAAPANDSNLWWQLNLFVILPVRVPTAGVFFLFVFQVPVHYVRGLVPHAESDLAFLGEPQSVFLQRNEKYWQDSKKSNVWNLLMNVLSCLFLALTICVFFSRPISGNQAAVFKLWMCCWKQGHTWGKQMCSVHVCVGVYRWVCVGVGWGMVLMRMCVWREGELFYWQSCHF